MSHNLILNADSYKASHAAFYPEGSTGQFAYIEARVANEATCFFGLQMFIREYLSTPVTHGDIREAEKLFSAHGVPFNKIGWEIIVDEHNGFLPLLIQGLPEGSVVPSRTPLVVIETTDPRLFWLASYIETALQRAIWYPTTIASNGLKARLLLESLYAQTSDVPEMAAYALHDFGARGVTSRESAAIGGVAHLVNFQGTDNLQALIMARDNYFCRMAGFSIPATEHSVQCAYGRDNQGGYLRRVLDAIPDGGIVSIVLDGYDIYNDTSMFCNVFGAEIQRRKIKAVIRPDSGDAVEVIPLILEILDAYFESTVNSKGYKVLSNVGIIQGDGIDFETLVKLTQVVEQEGYAAENVVYGSGGGLLQKLNRDTYKFAQKTSAMEINGKWVDTVKDPVTDPGKRSKGGRLTHPDFVDYYFNGQPYCDDSLEDIRKRARAGVIC
jgi:nicotinamide phosphoribosyltransferase